MTRGYTLVELMVCVAVVATLSAVALPRLAAADARALDDAAYLLAADLRWMQQRSLNIARGTTDVPAANTELIPRMDLTAGSNARYMVMCGSETLQYRRFADRVYIEGEYDSIHFEADGRANWPATITLRQDQRIRKVVVDSVGRVRVE